MCSKNKEHWIKKGFSEEIAQLKIKEHQAIGSKENFIKHYGEIEGIKKWELRQENWYK